MIGAKRWLDPMDGTYGRNKWMKRMVGTNGWNKKGGPPASLRREPTNGLSVKFDCLVIVKK